MSYNREQLRDLIERTLKSVSVAGFHSDAAVNLLLGTAAQESAFGTYLRQMGGGPALGAFQMEPPTFEWLFGKYRYQPFHIMDGKFEDLEWDLRLAIIMARLRYWVIPGALPHGDDLDGLAAYYKRYYNTEEGAATPEQFKANYLKYMPL